MERKRTVQPGLAPAGRLIGGLAAAAGLLLTVTGCVAGDPTSAGFGDEASSLPSVTSTTTTADSSTDSSADSSAVEASTPAETTTTTEPPAPLQGLSAELIADGFDQPILVASAPGTDDLFVVEREGLVRVVGEDGVVADEPFLDLSDPAVLLSSSIEQGLLGLVFHPEYAVNGQVFAYWTDAEGDSVLARFDVPGAPAATVADPDSMSVILQVDQPAERHNAGHLAFGPDGLLYLALGDGGSGGATAQDTSNLLGAILRLDIDAGDGYAVPVGNPFDDEIWVYGLRNPWRFSIDAEQGLVWIGDVGQDGYEEINVVGLDGAGTNFGWAAMEGDECFRSGCDLGGKEVPVLQYNHEQGCSVTGGYVYRGRAIPEFSGHYFFGDWCQGFVRSFRLDGDRVVDQLDHDADLADIGQVTSFGLDRGGELLTVNWAGQLHRITPVR